MENIEHLINELTSLPAETEWVEFKENKDDPIMIASDISALANAATLHNMNYAYMVWGVNDDTHEIVGTKFNFRTKKKGNEELQTWLRKQLSQNADYEFGDDIIDGKNVVVLAIHRAMDNSVMFEKTDYIRIGTYTKKLNDFPIVKVQLWEKLRQVNVEMQYAKSDLQINEVLNLLDYITYFDRLEMSTPSSQESIMHYLLEDKLVVRQDDGLYSISNLGAILLAKRMRDFNDLNRQSLRIAQYKNNNRIDTLKEYEGTKGYAVEFDSLIDYIEALLPSEEIIGKAFRENVTMYPDRAIREAVANALIHQDLAFRGGSILVEIFTNRIEITNPGSPLVDIKLIINDPPQTRNDKLASLMRRFNICEERGTGWDKIVGACEDYQLPAPKVEALTNHTRVTIFAPVPFKEMYYEDKLRACYQHACLRFAQGHEMNNPSLRERFGLDSSKVSVVSRIIKDAVEAKLIKPVNPDSAPRLMVYIPCWA